jgi:uncharacterized membrane protein
LEARVELGRILGLPAHPLLVHLPVMLVPLGALGAVLIVVSRRLRARYGWLVVIVTAVALAGAQLAAGSGEAFEEALGDRSDLLERHTSLGDTFIWFAAALFVAALAVMLLERRHALTPADGVGWCMTGGVTAAIVSVIAVAAVVQVYRVGHTGATVVWEEDGAAFDAG